jgi:hypothetical protein
VSLDATGPGTVLAGAGLLLIGSVGLLLPGRTAARALPERAPGSDRLPESGTGAAADPSH